MAGCPFSRSRIHGTETNMTHLPHLGGFYHREIFLVMIALDTVSVYVDLLTSKLYKKPTIHTENGTV